MIPTGRGYGESLRRISPLASEFREDPFKDEVPEQVAEMDARRARAASVTISVGTAVHLI
jgi:hypothetical protein